MAVPEPVIDRGVIDPHCNPENGRTADKFTVPLKPLVELTSMVRVAVEFCGTGDGEMVEMVKSGTIKVNVA